jgi:hypothetical protein
LSDVRSDIPLDLERVILRCLEKEPQKRFQDAGGLEKALSECLCARDWTEEEATEWWRKRETAKDGAMDRNQTLVYAGTT